MERFKKGCFYGSMGGMALYIIEFFFSLLPYMNISNLLFEIWFITNIVIGGLISVGTLLYKRTSLLEMVTRFVVMVGTYFIIIIINGYLGITIFLYNILGTNMNSLSDNISGMLTLTFWIIIIVICIIVMVIEIIRSLLNKKL